MLASHSFLRKLVAATTLLIFAQWLFYGHGMGATLGVFALAWCGALAVAVPVARHPVLGIAALLGLVMIDDPSLLAWSVFWVALASAALLPRHRFDDAASWAVRLVSHGVSGLVTPVRDSLRMLRRQRGGQGGAIVRLLALPVIGGAIFFALFAIANPLIGTALSGIALPSFWDGVFHLLFWSVVIVIVWPSLRPRAVRLAGGLVRDSATVIDLSVATLALSLGIFNAVFALQNILDVVFLWSGAGLPDGVTLADYAHRGAYTLIATALLAGAFVLVALAPGARAARSPWVRRLLVLWIAQNILLVASSMLRLIDYIAAYSLTELRIAALAWMALVAVGLALICWRLLAGRSAAWLVNANAAAAAVVLVAVTMVDLGAVAARWNVDHASRADQLDLCYLHILGPSALLPLIDLERRAGGPILRDRTRSIRRSIQSELTVTQADWHRWTWRGARRLAMAQARVGIDRASLRPARFGRTCDGAILPPPVTTELTNGSAQ
jgi:hypothetical protein